MSSILKPLQFLSKKFLTSLNKYLDPSYTPKYPATKQLSKAFHSKALAPRNIIKNSLNYVNGKFADYETHGKKFVRIWGAGILGMLLGALTYYTEDIRKFFTISLVERYQFMREDLLGSLEEGASKAIQQQVLKNKVVMTELQKLVYELCITLNIVHLTTQSINKLLKMESLNSDINVLVRQLLIHDILKNKADDLLTKVVVLVLKNEQNREILGQVIMNYLGGADFDQLVRTYFKILLEGNAFQQIMNSNAKNIVKGSLKDSEFKRYIFNEAKDFLYATNK